MKIMKKVLLQSFVLFVGIQGLDLSAASSSAIAGKAGAAKAVKAAEDAFTAAGKALGSNAKKIVASLDGLKAALAKITVNRKEESATMLKTLGSKYQEFITQFRKKVSVKDSAKRSLTTAWLDPADTLPKVIADLNIIRTGLEKFSADKAFLAPFDTFMKEYQGSSQGGAAKQYVKNMTTAINDVSFGTIKPSFESVTKGLTALNAAAKQVDDNIIKSKVTATAPDVKAMDGLWKEIKNFEQMLDKKISIVQGGVTTAFLTPQNLVAVKKQLTTFAKILSTFLEKTGIKKEGSLELKAFDSFIKTFKAGEQSNTLVTLMTKSITDTEGSFGKVTGAYNGKTLMEKLNNMSKNLIAQSTHEKNKNITQKDAPKEFPIFASFAKMIAKLEHKVSMTKTSKTSGKIDLTETDLPLVQEKLTICLRTIKAAHEKLYKGCKESGAFKKAVEEAEAALAEFKKAELAANQEAEALASGADVTAEEPAAEESAAEEPVSEPAEEPAEEPAAEESAAEEPVSEPAEEPAEEPAAETEEKEAAPEGGYVKHHNFVVEHLKTNQELED